MSSLNLELLQIPEPLRDKLFELSNSCRFTKQSKKGASGYLFFGTNLVHGQKIAVKFYYWAGDHTYHAEPKRLAQIDSPNITRILDAAFVDNQWAYFVTPYYEAGDLDDEMGSGAFGNLRAVDLTRGLLTGLSHLHAERLLHRDLKPQNIFIDGGGAAVIGDFGSVKRIPDGHEDVPGSGHSVLYRPPESISTNIYSRPGDLYQVGLVMYQLLGGSLPYEETAWLTATQLKKYNRLADHRDRSIYSTDILKRRIAAGRVIDTASLPPWVCDPLKRVLTKACHKDPAHRYQSCSEFLGKIAEVRRNVHDWSVEDGCAIRRNGVSYRILGPDLVGQYRVQKRRQGAWRNDNTIEGRSLSGIVAEIDLRCR